jgi:hypothetical protein
MSVDAPRRRSASRALAAAGVAVVAASVIALLNPWRLLVLGVHRLQVVAVLMTGVTTLVVAASVRPRETPRRLWEQWSMIVGVLAGWLMVGAINLAGAFFADIAVLETRLGPELALVRRHVAYGFGPDSSCYRFELRWGTGWATRFRRIGDCVDAELRWEPSAGGGTLTIVHQSWNSIEHDCTYGIDERRHTLVVIDASGCEDLGI